MTRGVATIPESPTTDAAPRRRPAKMPMEKFLPVMLCCSVNSVLYFTRANRPVGKSGSYFINDSFLGGWICNAEGNYPDNDPHERANHRAIDCRQEECKYWAYVISHVGLRKQI